MINVEKICFVVDKCKDQVKFFEFIMNFIKMLFVYIVTIYWIINFLLLLYQHILFFSVIAIDFSKLISLIFYKKEKLNFIQIFEYSIS